MASLLYDLKALLRAESQKWLNTDRSKTADRICALEVAIDVLMCFLEEGNRNAFAIAVQKYDITAKSVAACFYGASSKKQRDKAVSLMMDAIKSQEKAPVGPTMADNEVCFVCGEDELSDDYYYTCEECEQCVCKFCINWAMSKQNEEIDDEDHVYCVSCFPRPKEEDLTNK